jgi:hypothetical protein
MIDLTSFIQVSLNTPDDFHKVRETLSRIGVASQNDRILYQSCHILHKRGKYYVTHFKELFALDGKPSTISESDIARRNTIAKLLEEWGLVTIMNHDVMVTSAPLHHIKILTYAEKPDWKLVAKYTIGKKIPS